MSNGLASVHALAIDVGVEPALMGDVTLLGFLCIPVLGAEFHLGLFTQGLGQLAPTSS